MSERTDYRSLRRAAQRAELRPSFIASALSQYRALHRTNQEELAVFLGCARHKLPVLGLCRRPESSAPSFRTDVERIAAFVGLDSLQLAKLLREVDALTALRSIRRVGNSGVRNGFLMAARDRRADEVPPPGNPDQELPSVQQVDETDE